MQFNSKDFSIYIFVYLWTCRISQARHAIVPRSIPSLLSSSYYESLKETLRPVLERSNVSSPSSLESELDYDHSNKDRPDVEEPLAYISHHKWNNATNRYEKHGSNQVSKVRDSMHIPNKYYKFETNSIRVHSNKSSMAPSEHEVDYDYKNQDNPDVEEPPAQIFNHGHSNKTLTENTVKALVDKLRQGVEHKNAESLYEKYKANLSPLIKSLNLSSATSSQHKDAFRNFMENQKNISHSPPAKFRSLYDEFKKRLVDFSTELDIDAGLSNGKKHTEMVNYVRPKDRIIDKDRFIGYNGGIHGDHVTAEYRKVQNIVDRIEKENPSRIEHKKRYEPGNFQQQIHSPFDVKDWNYLKNDHRVDSGQQTTSNGNYIYNDYNNEDNFRPQAIFRKPEVPLTERKRPLRGIENIDKHYLTWSNNKGTDGSAYNKFFPEVYTDPINSQLANLSAQGLLENIARRLNTSTLDVAKRVAGIQGLNLSTLKTDPQLHQMLQEYIENTVISAAESVGIVGTTTISPNFQKEIINVEVPTALCQQTLNAKTTSASQNPGLSKTRQFSQDSSGNLQQHLTPLDKDQMEPAVTENKNGLSPREVSQILAKLMKKLEEIQTEKDLNSSCPPMGDFPCNLNGSWLSQAMGLRFDIALKDNGKQNSITNEGQSHVLNVTIKEYTPPKPHDIMGIDWPITGSALKGKGGPFFLYAQKHSENILATFVGYCRNCAGQDTIYGTWTFSFPSKSCQDTPVSFQTKNDVMRRYKLDEKRLERYREKLHKKTDAWKTPM